MKRKIKNNKVMTLDEKHNEYIKNFEKNEKNIEKNREELENLKSKLDILKNKSNCNNNDIEDRAKLIKKIKNMEEKIFRTDNKIYELDYFSNTLDFLVPYYDKLENNTKESSIKMEISDFFNKQEKPKKNDDDNKKENNKAQLYNNYLKVTENETIKKDRYRYQLKYCSNKECNNNEMILHLSDGYFICTNCGESEEIIMDSDKPNYKEPVPDQTAYAYKRKNHFKEWLNQTQGKETTDIPEEIYKRIDFELKKERLIGRKITPEKMRVILKKLNLNKYYEHIPYITSKVCNITPPRFSREVEEKLIKMFEEIQEPFTLYCPKERKNFLSYAYTIRKMLEILKLDDYAKLFPFLKSKTKLQEQDRIWKQICKHLKWDFKPSD